MPFVACLRISCLLTNEAFRAIPSMPLVACLFTCQTFATCPVMSFIACLLASQADAAIPGMPFVPCLFACQTFATCPRMRIWSWFIAPLTQFTIGSPIMIRISYLLTNYAFATMPIMSLVPCLFTSQTPASCPIVPFISCLLANRACAAAPCFSVWPYFPALGAMATCPSVESQQATDIQSVLPRNCCLLPFNQFFVMLVRCLSIRSTI
jgi:hypothetical protein